MLYSIMVDLNCSCNLNCYYCRTDKKIYDYDIFKTVQIFLNKKIFKSGDIIYLDFKSQEMFFGIEKLEFIFNRFLIDSIDKNYKLILSIVTNGTLLGKQEIQEFLYNYRYYMPSFILSLDGYKDVQDLQRPGSWDRIVENWDFLRKYTNDNIIINSVCSNKSLNIYAESIKKLLNNFEGIKTISSNLDMNNGYTTNDADLYLEQIEILILYLKKEKSNIRFLPVENIRKGKKYHYRGISYLLRKNTKILKYYYRCYKCSYLDCDIYYKSNQDLSRLDTQCYLFNKLESLNKRYYNEKDK